MSMTINIYYTGRGNAAKEFASEMISSGIVSEVRQKKGNIKYEYFLPIDDQETVLLIDRWENQKALDEYHQSQTMAKIMRLREKYDLSMRVERFIDNEEAMPRNDEKFIRVDEERD